MGRPKKFNRDTEVFSIRVPRGVADLIRTGFKAIDRLSGERRHPVERVLWAQRSQISELHSADPEIADAAVKGLDRVLEVLGAARANSCGRDSRKI